VLLTDGELSSTSHLHPRQKLYKLQRPATSSFLSKMGFPRTFPQAVVYVASNHGGLAFRHLGCEQGVQKCLQVLKHLRTATSTGKAYHIILQHYQLVSGLPQPILQDTQPSTLAGQPLVLFTQNTGPDYSTNPMVYPTQMTKRPLFNGRCVGLWPHQAPSTADPKRLTLSLSYPAIRDCGPLWHSYHNGYDLSCPTSTTQPVLPAEPKHFTVAQANPTRSSGMEAVVRFHIMGLPSARFDAFTTTARPVASLVQPGF